MNPNDFMLLKNGEYSAFPALKTGTLLAGMVRAAPVCELRPSRAARSRTSNVRDRISCTLSPFCRAC